MTGCGAEAAAHPHRPAPPASLLDSRCRPRPRASSPPLLLSLLADHAAPSADWLRFALARGWRAYLLFLQRCALPPTAARFELPRLFFSVPPPGRETRICLLMHIVCVVHSRWSLSHCHRSASSFFSFVASRSLVHPKYKTPPHLLECRNLVCPPPA